jgi:hypothetical protein
MSAVITKIEISDGTKPEHVAHISVDELTYRGVLEIRYRSDNGGPIFLSEDSKKIIAQIGYNISTIKALIRESM